MNSQEVAKENQTKELHENRWFRPLVLILFIIILIYLGGCLYSSMRFLPRSYVLDTDLSGLSAEEANKKLQNNGLYVLVDQKSKNGRGVITDRIDLVESALARVDYDTEGLISAQDKFLWFTSFFNDTVFSEIHAEGSFDVNRLKLALGKCYSQRKENLVEPKDATLRAQGNEIKIIPEIEGNVVARETIINTVMSAAEAAVTGGGSQRVDLTDENIKPNVRSDDPNLNQNKELLGKVVAHNITINFTGNERKVLEGGDIVQLVKVSDGEVFVDDEKLTPYVDELSDRFYYNMYEHLEYDDLYEKLSEAILSEDDCEWDAAWYINYPTPGSRGNGSPSFVEISLGQQTLWYYEYGELILSSPVVTGQPPKFTTPAGYYTVTLKETNARLKAYDYDVRVSYWMGFDYSGYYGLHDAAGRGAFGGEIYKEDGSHGCVNLPYDVAQALFSRTYVGTEVFIYR